MKNKNKAHDLTVIQGPHCLADFQIERPPGHFGTDYAIDLVNELSETLCMKRKCDPRIVRGEAGRLSIYQIVSTSHIILHFGGRGVNADLFSCEPFDVGRSVDLLSERFGQKATIQYCQRNLTLAPRDTRPIPMGNMNALTSNPDTFTHALINWFDGDETLLSDIEHGTGVLKDAMDFLVEDRDAALPPSAVLLLDVDPILGSWDKGGFSGGYINLMKQMTIHSFVGINAAYTDIMGYTFDLQGVLNVIQEGFEFSFYEVDGIFQRFAAD